MKSARSSASAGASSAPLQAGSAVAAGSTPCSCGRRSPSAESPGIALTKLDVLDTLETVKVCTGYKLDGKKIDYLPAHAADQMRVEPVYEEIKGWCESTQGARSWADLPARAIKYVRRIEELIRCPVALVSTSPERDDTILVRDPFAG